MLNMCDFNALGEMVQTSMCKETKEQTANSSDATLQKEKKKKKRD